MRKITDTWEITQDKPLAFETYVYQETNFIPYESAEAFFEGTQKQLESGPIRSSIPYDEFGFDNCKMPGFITKIEMKKEMIFLTFVPEKLGKYWVLFK